MPPASRRLPPSIAIALPLLCAAAAPAATTNAPAQPAADYGRGFARFYQLGLPDVKGGQYVKFDYFSGRPSQMGANMYSAYMSGVQLRGNGWIVESASTNRPHRYITGAQEIDVYDREVVKRERRERRKAAMKEAREGGPSVVVSLGQEDEKTSGAWQAVDAAKDAEKAIAFLEEKASERYFSHQLRYMAGPLFFSAAHLYRTGYTNEANRIAELLFTGMQDRKQVVLAAVNTLADAQFADITTAFFEDFDWTVYKDDLLALLKRFRSGWQKAPAVKRLYTAVQDRIENPAPPPVEGEGLTGEDRELAAALCRMTTEDLQTGVGASWYGGWYGRNLWLLTPPEEEETGAAAAPAHSNAVAHIKARGFASIPLLLAMLDDAYLLSIDRQQLQGMHHSMHMSFGDVTEEQIDKMYDQLQRPVTRGEVARHLLQNALPAGDGVSARQQNIDNAEFRQQFRDWYEANKEKPVMDLAQVYLHEGDGQQKNGALRYLVQFGGDPEIETVEKTLLDSEFTDYANLVTWYVQQRGEKAAPFLDQYTNKLAEAIESGHDNAEWMKRSLQQLDQMASAGSFEKILEDIVAGEKNLNEVRSILSMRLMQGGDADGRTRALLEAAARVPEGADAVGLLGMVQYTRHMAGMMMHGGRTPTPPPPEKVKHPGLWKKLLADERPAAGRLTGPGTTTVGDTAAWMLESLYPSPDAAVLQWVRALGRRVLPLIRKRAEERLAGAAAEELSPLPSADNVSEEDLDALLAKLRGPQETTAVLSALSLDELLALRAPFSEQSNLWARAAVPAHRVRDVRIAESLAETFPGLAALEGQPLDPEILDTLIAQSLQQAAGGTPLTVAIQRHAGFEGVTIMAQAIDTNKAAFAAWAAHLRNADPEGRPMVTVNLSFPRRHAAAVWYGEPQIAVEPEPDPEESNDLLDAFEDELASDAVDSAVENRKMLQKTWRECLVPRCDVYPGASVVLTAVPATPPEE